MASTFSDRLGIELIGDGEQSNSWGTTTNNNFGNVFDEAISGFLSIDLATAGSTYTLTFTNGPVTRATQPDRQAVLRFHNFTAAKTIQVDTTTSPNNTRERIYRVINDGTSAGTIQFKLGSGGNTSDLIPPGGKAIIATDGTNFYTLAGGGSTNGANWTTTPLTTTANVFSGQKVFIDTATSGAFTITLPSAPAAGDEIAILDIKSNLGSAALTINPNGKKIFGATANGTVSTSGAGFTIVFTGDADGWIITEK
jgi:hypothetical protein|tara:strand:- start:465 stop:1226 length:762 start_codon:yes stop_codon:yes gene_type:complete